MKKIINGKEIEVEVLGGFTINKLQKRYSICSYQEKNKNLIMIFELTDNDELVSIKEEEQSLVLEMYQKLKDNLLNKEVSE